MDTKIIQITAGRGPIECSWVVAKVLKVFLQELTSLAIAYQFLHKENDTENGTVQSATIQLKGKDLSVLENWLGTIQWIGTSTFRKYNKRKNWFIGMYEIDKAAELQISEKEIQFQAIRSSGPGGQHVNKVSSAVRATHKLTGIQVLVMDSRSQHQNKKLAVQRLQEKVAEHNLKALKSAVQDQWTNHLNLERGNPVRVFTGTDFKKTSKTKTFKNKRKALKEDLRKQLE